MLDLLLDVREFMLRKATSEDDYLLYRLETAIADLVAPTKAAAPKAPAVDPPADPEA